MGHGRPTAAVVLGGIAAYIGYALAPEWTRLDWAELFVATSTFGLLIIVGLCLGIYGLFTGIESAVAAGNERSVDDGSAE
ncbi:hypothetical protein ACFO5R_03215 [Halosolutus amylolyticus]|uniref:Uncharacterized protein n=1 Tax=Halosolutus amylolyticus TaxID=2932267 RepID=A0ABD5PKQ4_9EURY|nr:hypothetical protein [Halosolutus amylolyticus]